MNFWLLKTEPSSYSYDDLVKDKKTVWDGVSSNAALSSIRRIRKGDKLFIYHTGDEKQIVAIAEATSDPYQDPKSDEERLLVFELKPIRRLKNPVTLSLIKANKKYQDYALVRQGRKSVVEVPEEYWNDFLAMSEKQAEQ